MVWISQVIDQDVNIFDGRGARRDQRARSVRVRAAADAHARRRLSRDRRCSGCRASSARIGSATSRTRSPRRPVRAGGQKTILTVPLANRQREIEREIDDLDRGVHLAALFFILLGAGDRAVDGGAHRGSGPPADARDAAHRARRLRRADRGPVGRRAAAARRRVQQHGGRAQGAARAARAHPPARGVGRDGAPGRARDQEPADADSAVGRASAARARRPRRAARATCSRAASRRSSGRSGCCGRSRRSSRASRRRRRRGRRRSTSRSSSPTVVDPYRTGLAGRIEIVNHVVPPLPARLRRSHAHRPRPRQHRRERAARDARPGRARRSTRAPTRGSSR